MGPLSLEDILRHEVALLKAKVEKLEEELRSYRAKAKLFEVGLKSIEDREARLKRS